MPSSANKEFDISLTIGGDAGQGVESSGSGFSLALKRAGYHVFSIADYRSRIRGGHNFYQIRVADRPVYCHSDPPHLLLALTEESIDVHVDRLAENGGVVYDAGFKGKQEQIQAAGVDPFPFPLVEIAEKYGSRVMINTAALGAVAGILGFDLTFMEEVIREKFIVKSEKIVQRNLDVVKAAFTYAGEHYQGAFAYNLPPVADPEDRMILNGNEAFALGAATGGCRFISAYPMTPATTILEWMTRRAGELGIVTKHAEDEIAAACMAIGASLAGARAMTSTSGGGFDLMVEALGLAGMTEVPLVVAEVQRGGPSTGLPTRTEQSDLLSVIHASHGEYPRIVLAPGTLAEYFECGWRSFNLADKYQTPVIVLADQHLASSLWTVDPASIDYDSIRIDRGKTLSHADLDTLFRQDLTTNGHSKNGNGAAPKPERYLRYAFADDGISARAIPGHPAAVYAPTSDEHDPEGHISENQENRRQMQSKRMHKLDEALADMRPPVVYGGDSADVTIICWGSTTGAVREAIDLLSDRGLNANMLHFVDVWPFPVEKVRPFLARIQRSVCVEQNYTGQFAKLLRMTTGYRVDHQILKYDGRPFSPQEIAASLSKEVALHA